MSTTMIMMLGMHILGDYYLQTDKLAQKKQHEFGQVLIHSILYAIAFVPLLFFAPWLMFVLLVVSHACIDSLKYLLRKVTNRTAVLFILDQTCHIAILYGVSLLYQGSISLPLDWEHLLKIIVLILCVTKPVSVVFMELFDQYRPLQQNSGIQGAGKVIGYLERLLLTALLVVGEYGVIGWIIAAKTLARSKQLSDSQAFCEYFLVGTLVSILSTFTLYLALYRW